MGFMEYMFGGTESTANPMRHWAHMGPQSVTSYYDQAIADARTQYDQYWSVWNQQMAAVERMFAGSDIAYASMYESSLADIDGQMAQANKQFDRQIADIRKQERQGQGALTRKAHASGLVGTTAQRDWKAGLEDRANEAVSEVEDRRSEAEERAQRARLSAESQLAAGLADTNRMAGSKLIDVLSMAPIGPYPGIELGFEKMQQLYGTPWESYAADIKKDLGGGLFGDVIMPAAIGGLTSGLTGGLSSLISGGFGNLFGGGGGGTTNLGGGAIEGQWGGIPYQSGMGPSGYNTGGWGSYGQYAGPPAPS
tara:strand:+ start:4273 stop:5199 length:927 start_codon:yes stop_codon:yes gene_type:complete